MARVVRPATFEPVPGSVTAIAATFSPAMIPGRYLARCSAVPNRAMCGADMYPLTSAVTAMPPLALASSSDSTIMASESPPPPPSSSPMARPSRPALPISFSRAAGGRPACSDSSTTGRTCRSTKARTLARNSSCSRSSSQVVAAVMTGLLAKFQAAVR